LLLLSLYTTAVSIQGTTSEAFSVAQNLLQTTMGQAARGTPFAFALVSGFISRQYTWPQYGNNASQSSSTPGYGPQLPLVLFTHQTANIINPSPVVADGLVVFTTQGLGSNLYALNATTGALVFNTFGPGASPFTGTLAIYQGIIYTTNSSGYVNAFTENGAFFGATNIGVTSANSYLQIENQNIEANLSFANSYNLTLIRNGPQSPALYDGGEYLSVAANSATTANIMGFSLYGSTLNRNWLNTLATSGGYYTPAGAGGNAIYFSLSPGGSTTLYAYTLGGIKIWSAVLNSNQGGGPAVFNSSVYVKTTNTLYGYTQSGTRLFATPFAATTAIDNFNFTPVATPSLVYTLVNDSYLVAFNPLTGSPAWNITLSTNIVKRTASPDVRPQGLAVAYGNAYAAVGNVLYAIGDCQADPGSNLLQTIAALYLNKQGACATLLLNKSYGSNKIAIYINNTYAPSLYSATFGGGSNVSVPDLNAKIVGGSQLSLNLWVNPVADPANDMFYAGWLNSAASKFECAQLALTNTLQCRFHSPANVVVFILTAPGAIVPYKWNDVALVYNGIAIAAFVNGQMVASHSVGSVSTTTTTGTFTMGGDLIASPGYLTGQLSNVQLYSIALTAEQLHTLYTQGLGSGPVTSSNVVAWWPLQGDTNDYAGYNYGIPSNGPIFVQVPTAQSNANPPGLQNSYQISRATIPLSINVNGTYKTYNIGVVIWR
jgi:hypothetical protein